MTNFTLYPWEEQQLITNKQSGALEVVQPQQSRVLEVPSQQLTDFFANEQFFKSHDIEESRHFCLEYFSYSNKEISVSQISMNEELLLTAAGQQYHMTEKAHNDLCRLLRIPIDFAYDIPTDLTAAIVQRLKSEQQQSVIMIAREDTIVAVVDPVKWAFGRGKKAQDRSKKKPHYMPVTNLSLLEVLEKVWSGQDVDTRIIITDAGMQVEILQKAESFTVEPVVGDVTRVGLVITNSETGGPLPVANGYSLRLRCTNGATVRIDDKDEERRGIGRFSSDWRCSIARRFDRFTDDLRTLMQSMQVKCGALQSAYTHMGEARLNDKQFFSWYRKALYLSRTMDDSSAEIDGMFGIEPKARQEIINREQERLRELRKEKTTVITPPQSTDLIAWEVFNGITQAARDELRYYRRAGLENLAADVVSAFMPSLN